jgi:uncharacterized membrane protein YhiD involved in acid resistance
MKYTKLVTVLYILAVIAIVSFSGGYLLTRTHNPAAAPAVSTSTPVAQTDTPAPTGNQENPFLSGIFTTDVNDSQSSWIESAVKIIIRLLLAVALSAALAFRPRRDIPFLQRNLYVAQTQILLAVVAAALMMIVGDNTARAFAIFAAVSLVRFRTNIKDPKEITVLLISLALGLAAGVGRWELGIFLCLFVLALLWLLEYNEPEKLFRSMELTVRTKDTDKTQDVLMRIFNKFRLDAEVRQLTPPDEKEPVGCIMYYLNLRLSVSTDRLSDQILALNSDDVEAIEWKQQKNANQIY